MPELSGPALAIILAGALLMYTVPPTVHAVEKAGKKVGHAIVHVVTLGQK